MADYLKSQFTVDESVVPYPQSAFTDPPTAPNPVLPSVPASATRRKVAAVSYPRGEVQLKNALLNGPVVAGITCYEDFQRYYTTGYYKPALDSAGRPKFKNLGGHAFLVYGWDSNGWLCRNSWGNNWGESGNFRIVYNALPAGDQNIETSATALQLGGRLTLNSTNPTTSVGSVVTVTATVDGQPVTINNLTVANTSVAVAKRHDTARSCGGNDELHGHRERRVR